MVPIAGESPVVSNTTKKPIDKGYVMVLSLNTERSVKLVVSKRD